MACKLNLANIYTGSSGKLRTVAQYRYGWLTLMDDSIIQAPHVAFMPIPLLCLFSLGRQTALVVDVGWQETTVLPVSTATAATPLLQCILSYHCLSAHFYCP